MARKIQILIVDDDPVDAELLVFALKRAGFDFTWELTHMEEDYLAKLDNNPDVIFSDCNMPRFSGMRALELLKERGQKIPFVILSGSMGGDFTEFTKESGATHCLEKGQLKDLKQIMQQILGTNSSSEPLP